MRVHVFGDSHAAYCFDRIDEATIYWVGPVTMHRAAKEAAQFVPKLMADRTETDALVFMFGEIDIRCHLVSVANRMNTTVEHEAKILAERYVETVAEIKRTLAFQKVVIAQPPFPTDRKPSADFPFSGSIEDRILAHKALSSHLKRISSSKGLLFLPFDPKYSNPDGTLQRKFSDDGVHIMPIEAKALAKSLERLLSAQLTFLAAPIDVARRRWNYIFNGPLRSRGLPRVKRLWI